MSDKKTYKITIEHEIPEQIILDILTCAVESGIAYWMNEDSTNVDYKRNKAGDIVECSFDNNATGEVISYVVKPVDILFAIQQLLRDRRYAVTDRLVHISSEDFDYDADDADVVFQMACFGEVVYG